MVLKDKREAFCQAIADGKTQSDAYRLAGYSVDKMKPETIQNNAYKLMQSNDILTRIQELRGQIESKQLWTREQAIETIKLGLETAKANNRPMELFKGVELLNRMHGFDAPQKFEVIKKKNIADMTDDELEVYHAMLEIRDSQPLSEEELEALARVRGLL